MPSVNHWLFETREIMLHLFLNDILMLWITINYYYYTKFKSTKHILLKSHFIDRLDHLINCR